MVACFWTLFGASSDRLGLGKILKAAGLRGAAASIGTCFSLLGLPTASDGVSCDLGFFLFFFFLFFFALSSSPCFAAKEDAWCLESDEERVPLRCSNKAVLRT